MKTKYRYAVQLAGLFFAMVFSLAVSAQENECSSTEDRLSDWSTGAASKVIRATPEMISQVMDIPLKNLQQAIATNPTYTVIFEDQVIPYHEFGPAWSEERKTKSGKSVFPLRNSLTIVSAGGDLLEIALPSMDELSPDTVEMDSKRAYEAQIEPAWAVIYPVLAAGTCWTAAQDCVNQCTQFIRSCPCGGECSCGHCGTAPSRGCATCQRTTTPLDTQIGG